MGLADYYDPQVSYVVGILLDTSLLISTMLFALTVYLITKKSSNLGKYRWYMLNSFVWSYAQGAAIALTKMSFLFPVTGFEYDVNYQVGDAFGRILFVILIGLFVNVWISIAISTAYRFSLVFTGAIYRFFNESITIYFLYAFAHSAAYAHVGVICFFFVGQQEAHEVLNEQAPQLAQIMADRTLMMFLGMKENPAAYVFVCWCFFVIALLSAASFGAFLVTSYRVRRLNYSAAMRRRQMMFLRALAVQATILTTCVVSYSTSLFLGWTGVSKSGPTATMMLALLRVHSCLDMSAALYFVAPYRRYLSVTFARTFRYPKTTSVYITSV